MEDQQDKRHNVMKEIKAHAESNGIRVNPDPKFVDAIVTGLLKNEERHGPGKRYCPCRPVTGNEEQDKKIICPCAFHMDEIKSNGRCHCGLFVRA